MPEEGTTTTRNRMIIYGIVVALFFWFLCIATKMSALNHQTVLPPNHQRPQIARLLTAGVQCINILTHSGRLQEHFFLDSTTIVALSVREGELIVTHVCPRTATTTFGSPFERVGAHLVERIAYWTIASAKVCPNGECTTLHTLVRSHFM